MLKIFNIFLSCTLILTGLAPSLQAQDLLRERLETAAQKERPPINSSIPTREQQMYSYSYLKNSVMFSVMNKISRAERALEAQDAQDFFNANNDLNRYLLENMLNQEAETSLLITSALVDQINQHLITAQDAKKAFSSFDRNLKNIKTCKDNCDTLYLSAVGLSFSDKKYLDAQNGALVNPVTSTKPYLLTIKEAASNDYGSYQANALMAKALLLTAARLGTLQDLEEVTDLILSKAKFRVTLSLEKMKVEETVFDTLLQLGKDTQPIIKKYAFGDYKNRIAVLQANIALAYTTPLTEEEDIILKQNLVYFYCHFNLKLNAEEDMLLKQKLGFAYGKGVYNGRVRAQSDKQCIPEMPVYPNPVKIADDWTEILAVEAAATIALIGVGSILNSAKNAYRAMRYSHKVKVAATGSKTALSSLFAQGKRASLIKQSSGAKSNFFNKGATQAALPAETAPLQNKLPLKTKTTFSPGKTPASNLAGNLPVGASAEKQGVLLKSSKQNYALKSQKFKESFTKNAPSQTMQREFLEARAAYLSELEQMDTLLHLKRAGAISPAEAEDVVFEMLKNKKEIARVLLGDSQLSSKDVSRVVRNIFNDCAHNKACIESIGYDDIKNLADMMKKENFFNYRLDRDFSASKISLSKEVEDPLRVVKANDNLADKLEEFLGTPSKSMLHYTDEKGTKFILSADKTKWVRIGSSELDHIHLYENIIHNGKPMLKNNVIKVEPQNFDIMLKDFPEIKKIQNLSAPLADPAWAKF